MRYMSPRQQRESEWQRIRAHFQGLCAYCGIKPAMLVREHMVPKSRGGDDSFENIITSCSRCNIQKGRRTPLEWFLVRCGLWQRDEWPQRVHEPVPTLPLDLELPPEPKPRPRRPHPLALERDDRCAICGHCWVRPVILMDDPCFPVRDVCTHCYADPAEFPRIPVVRRGAA